MKDDNKLKKINPKKEITRFMVIYIIAIFMIESLLMIFLDLVAKYMNRWSEILFDSIFLALFMIPITYVYFLKPMLSQLKQREKIEVNLMKFQQAVEQSPLSIIITDIEGNIDYVNPKFTALTEYNFTEVRGKNLSIFISGTQSIDIYKDMWTQISTGDEWYGEFHNIKKNGEGYWEFASMSAIRNHYNEITHYLIINEDITIRKQLEHELKESKDFIENLVQNLTLPTFVLDINHKVLIWNKACEELTGIKAVDVIGTDKHGETLYGYKRNCMADFILDGNIDEIKEYFDVSNQSHIGSGAGHGEYWFENPHMGKRYLIVDAAPIRNEKGEILAVIETLKDITERKIAEDKLNLAHKEINNIFDSAGDGMRVIDTNYNIVKVNKSFEDLTKIKQEDFLGKKCFEVFRSEFCHTPNCVLTQIKNGKKAISYDVNMMLLDGTELPCMLNAKPIYDSQGLFLGIVESFKDISERKQFEKFLQKENNRLQNELKLASSVQSSLFPVNLPVSAGIELSAFTEPAYEVGGDYADILDLDNGLLAIGIGDVMGKGVPAALIMAMIYAFVRNYSQTFQRPSQLVEKLNIQLFPQLEFTQKFITFFYCTYNSNNNELVYTNAGQNPPILYRAKEGEFQVLPIKDFILGGRRNAQFKEAKVTLEKNDIVIFYTDGLIEGMNKDREQFRLEKVKQIIKESSFLEPNCILNNIMETFRNFLAGEPAKDDVTIVILKIK